jgi:hypothetical protein
VLAFLKARKIVRPGYTTLQTFIADALTAAPAPAGGTGTPPARPGGVARDTLEFISICKLGVV